MVESMGVSSTTHKPTESYSEGNQHCNGLYRLFIVSNVCQVSVVTCVEPVEASAALVFCPG